MSLRLLISILLLTPVSLSAQSGWIEMASDHFVLYTDTDEEKGQRLLNDLEARHAAFSASFAPLQPRHSRVAVLLISDRDEYRRFLPGEALLDERVAYLFRDRDRAVLIARDRSPEDLIDDVGHSLGHLFLSRVALWQPFWLQEGAGEYIRRLGSGDTDGPVSEDDGYSIADLLSIVPSASYDDLIDRSDFRIQSYHLLRVLLRDYRQELSGYFEALGTQEGSAARLDIDASVLEAQVRDYEEVSIPLDRADTQTTFLSLGQDEANQALGDVAGAASADDLARDFYLDNPLPGARVGLAVLRKHQGESPTVRSAFELLVRTYPDSGWAQYHFGTLETERDDQRAQQITALERAVQLMPLLGRAHGELGYLYVLDGRPDAAMPLIETALELEPEFGDRFFEILAEAWLMLEDYERARDTMRKVELLPHSDPADAARYAVLVPQFEQRIQLYRREREADRVEALRRQVETLVEENDPVPPRVREEPAPIGRISYSISTRAGAGVDRPPIVEAPMPDYTPDLRRDGVEGRVVLDVDLDRRGDVVSIQVASADNLELAASSVDAVRRWEFQPAREGGASVPYSFRLTLRFYLE